MPKARANNITINYDQQGTGEPLILIPFLTADHACYAFQVPEYAKHFTCLSLDLRGTGETDKPEGVYSTELLAGSDEVWFLDRLESDWVYAMRLRLQDGRFVVAELKVFPFPDSDLLNRDRMKPLDFVSEIPMGGLTAWQLRRISFSKPIAGMRGLMKATKEIARHYRKIGDKNRQLGDKNRQLVHIAEVYVACLRRRSRRPTADCAQQLGLPLSRVRDAIHQARMRGLLTRSSRGQGFAGGELTPNALALLQRDSSSSSDVAPPRKATAPAPQKTPREKNQRRRK